MAPAPKDETPPEKKELEKVSTLNQLAQQKLLAEMQKDIEAKERQRILADRLAEEQRLLAEQRKAKLAEKEAELQRLNLENRFDEEQHKTQLAEIRRQKEKLAMEKEKLLAENDIEKELLRKQELADEAERQRMELETKRMDFDSRKMKYDEEKLRKSLDALKNEIDIRTKKEEWKSEANKEPTYLKSPFQDGILTVSDRRISLNGPIFGGVADYVTERIHYYNNKSAEPIFIVVDKCPGGSVMEGYRIVKAMQASQAPVHVVVKSYAASMAAVITALAQRSYAYPNAIILHHQMSSVQWGNMTQLKEQLEIAKEWYKRLAEPVAKKMGMSTEAMVKLMYEKNSDGDWEEFADNALKYKWVDNVVHEIRETGIVKDPDKAKKPELPNARLEEKTDEKGRRYVELPRLDPYDFYYIYNPDQYYR
jgi:ATP-dependent Clp protease protease subunit